MHARSGMPLSCLAAGLVLFVATPPVRADGSGDYNGDGNVDAADFAELPGCLGGPGVVVGAGCDPFDFDGDLDVDAFDIAGFQLAFGTSQSVVIETVTIGNPGNAGEQSRIQNGDPTFYGAVAYTYSIGKYEVTAGQYTAFLNAVAATDTYGLYDTRMDYDADPNRSGCNIKRHGAPGNYTYSVAPDWANRPVNYVSFGDAARFANWLHNGQPTGMQDLTTTEDGSYFLNGATSDSALIAVTRDPNATWVIPSEDEWYKAAYHKNDGVTGNYFNYPTSNDNRPSNDLIDPDPGNHATFFDGVFGDPNGFTIGAPYYRTQVGEHENSQSPYGTFDQGGNVLEWNEVVIDAISRGARGGSFVPGSNVMRASDRPYEYYSPDELRDIGFRVAEVP